LQVTDKQRYSLDPISVKHLSLDPISVKHPNLDPISVKHLNLDPIIGLYFKVWFIQVSLYSEYVEI
jgi:hypothetical protein